MVRALACLGLVCLLVGCESDVDFCGGGRVCGVDGTTYSDYCEAGGAGVDVDYAGPCTGGCSDVTCEIACQYGFAVGADGCPVCECAPPPECTDDRPCTLGDVCVDGRCAPPRPMEDAGVDANRPDGDSMDANPCDPGTILCGDECRQLGTLTDCTACDDACDAISVDDLSATNVCDSAGSGCKIECAEGLGDCDGDPSNGCEVTLDSHENCGACGNTCARFGGCDTIAGGPLECLCPERIPTECDGRCTNVDYDPQNCGGCGVECGAGQACRSGSCVSGDDCSNPANWRCNEGDGSCDVSCGGRTLFFNADGGGSLTCEGPGAGVPVACLPPSALPEINCDACIQEAALCCLPAG